MFNFTETKKNDGLNVPCIENARADFAPYYAPQNWSIGKAKNAVTAEVGKLGGAITDFKEGYFGSEDNPRYGYVIEFVMNGAPGRIQVAGLPICNRLTEQKIEKVRIQALLNVRDWLKAGITSMIFSPGNNPLTQHLIGQGGKTLAEMISAKADISVPLLVEYIEE